MKERAIFWALSAVFVSVCICLILFGRLTLRSEQVYVVTESASEAQETPFLSETDGSAEESVQAPSGKVNINTADADELKTLPGIGDVIAERIIAYREENGGFDSAEELMEVSGIGEAKFNAVKDMIAIG